MDETEWVRVKVQNERTVGDESQANRERNNGLGIQESKMYTQSKISTRSRQRAQRVDSFIRMSISFLRK